MDELIYQFLLQAGYPRAAIVADASLIESARDGAPPEDATTYVVVDPETAARLAVIDVVEAIGGDALREAAAKAARYARRIGGREVQGFVIRVDTEGRCEAEQVQFYRVWPNPSIQQLTAKTFPDLDGLRVTNLLALERAVPSAPEIVDFGEDENEDASAGPDRRGTAGRYVPAIVLILLALADWYVGQTRWRGTSRRGPGAARDRSGGVAGRSWRSVAGTTDRAVRPDGDAGLAPREADPLVEAGDRPPSCRRPADVEATDAKGGRGRADRERTHTLTSLAGVRGRRVTGYPLRRPAR